MPKKVKDIFELIEDAKQDVLDVMDSVAYQLFEYTDSFIYNAYRKECPTFWPMYDEQGEEIKNPKTGEPFTEDERPERLAYLLRSQIRRGVGDDPDSRSIKVWVDVEGLPNEENLETVGRLLETFGCRPWTRLKADLDSDAGVKKVSDKARISKRKMVSGTS
jgi:hypothetical protein